MNVHAFLALCFLPLAATFLLLVILVPGIKTRHALWSCLLGLAAVLPITFVQYAAGNAPVFGGESAAALLLTALVINGVIEEALKAVFLLFLPQKRLPLAAFFSCALVFALALASFESVIYLARQLQSTARASGTEGAYRLLLARTATAVLVHVCCAGLSALGIRLAKGGRARALPFLHAMLLHGVYDFFARLSLPLACFSIAALLLAALECRIWYAATKKALYPPAGA